MHIPTGPNIIIILAVVLLIFGPNRLPDLARQMGRALSDFKHAMRDVQDGFDIGHTGAETRIHTPPEAALSAGGHYDTTAESYHPYDAASGNSEGASAGTLYSPPSTESRRSSRSLAIG